MMLSRTASDIDITTPRTQATEATADQKKPFYTTTTGIVVLCIVGASILATCIALPLTLGNNNTPEQPRTQPSKDELAAIQIQKMWRLQQTKRQASKPSALAALFNQDDADSEFVPISELMQRPAATRPAGCSDLCTEHVHFHQAVDYECVECTPEHTAEAGEITTDDEYLEDSSEESENGVVVEREAPLEDAAAGIIQQAWRRSHSTENAQPRSESPVYDEHDTLFDFGLDGFFGAGGFGDSDYSDPWQELAFEGDVADFSATPTRALSPAEANELWLRNFRATTKTREAEEQLVRDLETRQLDAAQTIKEAMRDYYSYQGWEFAGSWVMTDNGRDSANIDIKFTSPSEGVLTHKGDSDDTYAFHLAGGRLVLDDTIDKEVTSDSERGVGHIEAGQLVIEMRGPSGELHNRLVFGRKTDFDTTVDQLFAAGATSGQLEPWWSTNAADAEHFAAWDQLLHNGVATAAAEPENASAAEIEQIEQETAELEQLEREIAAETIQQAWRAHIEHAPTEEVKRECEQNLMAQREQQVAAERMQMAQKIATELRGHGAASPTDPIPGTGGCLPSGRKSKSKSPKTSDIRTDGPRKNLNKHRFKFGSKLMSALKVGGSKRSQK